MIRNIRLLNQSLSFRLTKLKISILLISRII